VETVLSTDKYRRLVTMAKQTGHQFQLIYVVLDNPERNIERIKTRVANGGHAVPDEKVHARYWRSLGQLPWFMDQADHALIYDNSGATPRLAGEKKNARTWIDVAAPASLRTALNAA
jgi:predicted ABC-type ATPase